MRSFISPSPVVALILGYVAVGCEKPAPTPANQARPASISNTLQYQWQAKRYDFQFELSQDLDITTTADQIDSYLRVKQAYSLTPEPQPDQPGFRVRMRFLDQQVSVLEGNIQGTYDSSSPSPPSSQAGDMLAASFGKITDQEIVLQLSSNHLIESVEGLDAILKSMTTGIHPNIRSMIFSIYDEDRIRQLVYLTQLPTGELSNGHAWPIQESRQFGLLGNTKMDGTARLHGLKEREGRTHFQIEISGTAKQAPDLEATNQRPYVLTDGTFKGRAWFDPELGQYSDTVLNYDLNVSPNSPSPSASQSNVQKIRVIQKYTTKLLNVVPGNSPTPSSERPSQR